MICQYWFFENVDTFVKVDILVTINSFFSYSKLIFWSKFIFWSNLIFWSKFIFQYFNHNIYVFVKIDFLVINEMLVKIDFLVNIYISDIIDILINVYFCLSQISYIFFKLSTFQFLSIIFDLFINIFLY